MNFHFHQTSFMARKVCEHVVNEGTEVVPACRVGSSWQLDAVSPNTGKVIVTHFYCTEHAHNIFLGLRSFEDERPDVFKVFLHILPAPHQNN